MITNEKNALPNTGFTNETNATKHTRSKNRKNSVRIFHSIRTRIIGLIILGVVLSVVAILANTIPRSSKAVESAIQSNMHDVATAYMDLLDKSVQLSSSGTLSSDELTKILSKVKINNVDSSFLFVVDKDGKMLYNPDTSRIGVVSTNSLVVEITSAIKTNTNKKSDISQYTSTDGVEKYASYAVSDNTKWVLIVTANKKDILSPITTIVNTSLISAFAVILVLGIAGYFFASSIIGPITKLTKVVQKTSDLDFSTDETIEKLSLRKDETGEISRMTARMQDSLRNMVVKIEHAATDLIVNAQSLTSLTRSIDEACTENSATSEELAASMEETSATAETIDSNVVHIQTGTENINQKSIEGLNLAKEIMTRAENLHTDSISAKNQTVEMYNSVKTKSEEAIEQSKAVDKINVLSSTIQDIASQTSLLSLNASIEAARAGESGRGFAVVADEIGKLANQSSTTVSSILEIVAEIHQSVDNMSDCLKTTLEFLESKVMTDYNGFVDVSMKYSSDAKTVELSMKDINEMADVLDRASNEIVDAISGINTTISDSARGVTDIAEKTTNVVMSTTEVTELVHRTKALADELDAISKMFKL
ncbi:methyl-accepting chemotaxis protein [[Clostridium] fimetarium]|uniref:Methyl-accepting chemotaxis protein n=1 Tax=[Clostridium] fimetarium TaxID=99656 RepID=A0A1I0RPK0_9FIRM|nr:methyl-accepting chemotaxis protein [[Clostridium] fimetarium]SEW42610.1 methyl-accepting chemotaxis protein [[Clostridium] fimetarium]